MASILVPLDGSALGAAALPYAKLLSRRLGHSLRLLTVVGPSTHDDRSASPIAMARQALDELAATLRQDALEVAVEVREGAPADEIDDAADGAAAFVVLSSRGHTGLSRWLRGGIADRVIRRSTVPVLVVHISEPAVIPSVRRVALPVDGSPAGEAGAGIAVEIARAFDADLDIVRVVPWSAFVAKSADSGFLAAQRDEELERDALEYVETVRERLDYPKAHGVILRGSPADELVSYAAQLHVDMIVMSSHGHAGVVGMVLGSVTDRVSGHGVAPVLIVPAGAKDNAPSKRPRCYHCGRSAPPRETTPTDTCPRCGRHLHVCDNCVFFTGSVCLRDRPDVNDTPRGRLCQEFIFRETPGAPPAAP